MTSDDGGFPSGLGANHFAMLVHRKKNRLILGTPLPPPFCHTIRIIGLAVCFCKYLINKDLYDDYSLDTELRLGDNNGS